MSGFISWIQSAIYNLIVPLLPNSLQELLLFIVTVVLVIIIIDLFVYTNIQRRIKNDSRCYQENKNNLASPNYITYVKTTSGITLASITYDRSTQGTSWQPLYIPPTGTTYSDNSRMSRSLTIPYFAYINGKKERSQLRLTNSPPGITNDSPLTFTGPNSYFNRFTQYGTGDLNSLFKPI